MAAEPDEGEPPADSTTQEWLLPQLRRFLRYRGHCSPCVDHLVAASSAGRDPGSIPATVVGWYTTVIQASRGRITATTCGDCATTGDLRHVDPHLCDYFEDARIAAVDVLVQCSPTQLDCLWLSTVAKLTDSQISQALGLGIGACRSHRLATTSRISRAIGLPKPDVDLLLAQQRLPGVVVAATEPGDGRVAETAVQVPDARRGRGMKEAHTVLCSPAVFELIAPDAPAVPVKVDLTYHSRDPYAVQTSFRTGNGTAVDWVFARDLLQEGLAGPVGTGDVQVQPVPGNPSKVQLELSSPSGHALFTTCAQTLGEFLRRTYKTVPPESEYDWLDFDLALSYLLNDPARD